MTGGRRPAQVGRCSTTMAWEQRGNQSYYYRSVRTGTRVTKEYAGGGLTGALAADLDDEQRERRARERAQLERDRHEWSDLERPALELDDLVELLTTVTLTTAGFRRHDRGEWRLRRG